MRVSIAVSGKNSALSISDYSAHTSQMPCPRQDWRRSRNVHAFCLLSGVCSVLYSCKTKFVSALGAPNEPEQPQISLRCVQCVFHFTGSSWALKTLLARRIGRLCQVFGDGKTLYCQGLPRSRNVHACCLLSSVCDVHCSVS